MALHADDSCASDAFVSKLLWSDAVLDSHQEFGCLYCSPHIIRSLVFYDAAIIILWFVEVQKQ